MEIFTSTETIIYIEEDMKNFSQTVLYCGIPCILFTNCSVSWDTLYIVHKLSCIVGYPVYCSQTVLFRGIPCILNKNQVCSPEIND